MTDNNGNAAVRKQVYHVNAKNVFRLWLEYIPFRFLCMVIKTMPLKMGYALSGSLFHLLYRLDRKHRNRAIKHVLHAGITDQWAKADAIAAASFNGFSKLLVEIVKMDQLFKPEKLKMTGPPETLRSLCGGPDEKTNVINLTAHYGNWEAAGRAWTAHTGLPLISVTRPFSNPLIGNYIMKSRESDLHRSIAKEGAIKGMLKALKDGKSVAMLVDQHAGSKMGIPTMFFGHPCRSHASPALLHLKTGVPIVVHVTRRIDDDFNFEIITSDLIRHTPTDDKERDVQEITQMYTTALEKLIREVPEQWMWAHRRWTDIHR